MSCCTWCLCFLLCLRFLVCNACLHKERSALVDIGNKIGAWTHPSDGNDCCRWDGVTCSSGTGRVTGLDLTDLGGVIYLLNATWFLPFEELQSLSLSNLAIQGCLPGAGFEIWSSLHKLEILDLSNNQLNDSAILFLDSLPSLRSLFLNTNLITSAQIVKRLSKRKLEVLDLSWNVIVDNISTDICNVTSLQELHLNANLFFGHLPSCFRNLTSLRVLDLSYNLLTINFPSPNFENMPSLVRLSLSYNHLEGILSLSSFSKYIQLKYLGLSSNSTDFQVRAETLVANISIQLQVIELSNCNLNANFDALQGFFLHQHGLHFMDLSNNNLSGRFPMWLIENNTDLLYLNVQNNSFDGPIVLPSKVNTNLLWLDASCNMLNREVPVGMNVTFPKLYHLNLSRNFFQGTCRSSLGYIENLLFLDISYNNFSDDIAASFFGPYQSSPASLFLSNNSFYGSLPELNSTSLQYLVLDNNDISGEIPTSICENSMLGMVDISNNRLTGTIPNCICNPFVLQILNLRGNHLSGSIPADLSNCSLLQFLDLSKNHLSGQIPPLPNLTYLHLSENNFNGTFPLPVSFNPYLKTVDLRYNQLGGTIPSSIAEAFPELRVLLLKGNLFEGMISIQVCQLKYLRLLDLSNNMLSGHIPSCLSSMGLYRDVNSFLFQYSGYRLTSGPDPDSFGSNDYSHSHYDNGFQGTLLEIDQEEFTTKSRQDYYKGSILSYMSGLLFEPVERIHS
ncbi:hypothetical protein HU200_055383 [Digitaria exilis]|uniref:Leucine-rich repeat-containing N-terminal plant-type domain-containing protein n=1 Tax=Digitaria exilis TaxID=1010633 RepID=A0A835E4R0_9POAL|nr:hypothetical protein HU200_055383 [Digitaria exilis]